MVSFSTMQQNPFNKTLLTRRKDQPVAAPVAQAVTFPLNGTYRLSDLLQAYNMDLDTTRLPESNRTLREYLNDMGVRSADQVQLKIDPSETPEQRMTRWGFPTDRSFSIDTRQEFTNLTLATFESFFTVNKDAPPPVSHNQLSNTDNFANALFREVLGHDLYVATENRKGQETGLADGSVLFETAFAPHQTSNAGLIRNHATFLSHLDILRFDAQDGKLNGHEQKVKTAYFFDKAAGTNYTAAVDRYSVSPKAILNASNLQGISNSAISEAGQRELAALAGTSLEAFTRANVVFHAITIGGASNAASGTVSLTDMNRLEAQGALSGRARPGSYGFISSLYPQVSKDLMKSDLDKLAQSGTDAFLWGDGATAGTAGTGSFLDKVFFDQFGISSTRLRQRGLLG